MREIHTQEITETIARLCQEANFYLPEDVIEALRRAAKGEESPLGRRVLERLLENAQIAAQERVPLCQDCGVVVVLLEVGQEVRISGGDLLQAVEEGVRRGYREGYLRTSMVRQPFGSRINTGDNTPPVLHTEMVPGEHLKITVMPKGAGCENMSRLGMLKPGEGRQGIIDFVLRTVEEAGGNPCPPVIVGVGIGGTTEKAMLLAKRALLRPVGEPSLDPEVASLEQELLERVNALGIGPLGFGGRTTALAVHIESFATHIASLPVAVNLQCHSARYRQVVL